MRLYFYLDDDTDEGLITWWLSLPKGARSVTMRRMMRWYSGQQGFGELIETVKRLIAHEGPTTTQPEPEVVAPAPPPNVAELMADAMSQLFADED